MLFRSIDDTGPRFEYQRTNAEWNLVCANLDRFRNLKEIYSNIQLQICCTVNVFNVYYLDRVAAWIKSNRESFDFVYWNMLHEIEYFSISKLPRGVKSVLSCTYKPAKCPKNFAENLIASLTL